MDLFYFLWENLRQNITARDQKIIFNMAKKISSQPQIIDPRQNKKTHLIFVFKLGLAIQ